MTLLRLPDPEFLRVHCVVGQIPVCRDMWLQELGQGAMVLSTPGPHGLHECGSIVLQDVVWPWTTGLSSDSTVLDVTMQRVGHYTVDGTTVPLGCIGAGYSAGVPLLALGSS
jgi:hypothetical protein